MLTVVIICMIFIQIYFIYIFGVHSSEFEKQISTIVWLVFISLFVQTNNNFFLYGTLIPISTFIYFWYKQYHPNFATQIAEQKKSNKMSECALELGTINKILLHDPNKDGSVCINGICSMTVNDFLNKNNV